jgi:hypothetical protein
MTKNGSADLYRFKETTVILSCFHSESYDLIELKTVIISESVLNFAFYGAEKTQKFSQQIL